MKNLKSLHKGIASIALAILLSIGGIYIGVETADVFAATENLPTIKMGDNAPMTRAEFMQWIEQRGIRFFNIEGSILPADIFFDGYNGKALRYGELSDRILPVYLISGVVSSERVISANSTQPTAPATAEVPATEQPSVNVPNIIAPIIFEDLTPMLFTDDELTAMIERVPHQNPLDITSAITLPNRRLSDSELEAWIDDYNEIGGASAFELGVIREVNRVRVQHGLQPLALNPVLMMSSRLKAQEFGDLQYYNHRSPMHGSPTDAAQMFGFEGMVGESMTRTGRNGTPIFRSTPVDVVAGMLASNRGHRELLLNPNLYSVGFGAFFSPNSTGANGNMSHMFYFVTQFEINPN